MAVINLENIYLMSDAGLDINLRSMHKTCPRPYIAWPSETGKTSLANEVAFSGKWPNRLG